MNKHIKLITFLFLLPVSLVCAMSIDEKKRSFEQKGNELNVDFNDQLVLVNEDLWQNRRYLESLYQQVTTLYRQAAPEEQYCDLLKEINTVKANIVMIEKRWRNDSLAMLPDENYALWHQPDTNLLQLVMDYGTQDFVYLVPPEIGLMRVSINSNLPIPRESWNNMLELILAQNGVGMRQLNPYLRELYLVKQDPSGLKYITNNVKDLEIFTGPDQICFVLSPQGPDPRSVLQFLQKFSNPITTTLQMIGGDIFIVAQVETIKELLKLYEFVNTGKSQQDYQLITLTKVNAKEMESILNSAFFSIPDSNESNQTKESSGLRVVPLSQMSQSLFLCGSKDQVSKAIKMVKDLEAQIEDPREKTVFWYTAKHSDAEDLAQVLAKVYDALSNGAGNSSSIDATSKVCAGDPTPEKPKSIIPPISIQPLSDKRSHRTADGQNNFIVDSKTGSIIMVVEQDALPKIKDLLRKLDVPKKMVQIEILLFEKKITAQNNFGLNLLKIGSAVASNTNAAGMIWKNIAPGAGIMEFLFSHKRGSGIPAYDLAYNFLISQEDVQINASPSVTTVNQTPATIAIVDEISINNGVQLEGNDHAKLKESFSRAEYGIIIQVTPTINIGDSDEDGLAYITLDTDITFDTTKKNSNDRPDVTRRHIKNHVRIADGQTVILGGLRRKSTQDTKDSIPFLGEIPGIGKLFSSTSSSDSSTEMFVFLTPKIIYDPVEDLERLKYEELSKRPGDVPQLIQEILEAKNCERKRLFDGSLTALFGRQDPEEQRTQPKEYDGR